MCINDRFIVGVFEEGHLILLARDSFLPFSLLLGKNIRRCHLLPPSLSPIHHFCALAVLDESPRSTALVQFHIGRASLSPLDVPGGEFCRAADRLFFLTTPTGAHEIGFDVRRLLVASERQQFLVGGFFSSSSASPAARQPLLRLASLQAARRAAFTRPPLGALLPRGKPR